MGDLEPRMRAGDADRTKVVETLGRHLGEGRLTVEEFDQRAAQAHAAVYLDQLPPLLADLPGDPPPAQRPAPRPAPRRPRIPSVAFLLLVALVLTSSVVALAHGAAPVFAVVVLFLFLRHRRWSRRW